MIILRAICPGEARRQQCRLATRTTVLTATGKLSKILFVPEIYLGNKRNPTQNLTGTYDIHNDPWPPDSEVETGFYRIDPDGTKVIHSAPTPVGIEERW